MSRMLAAVTLFLVLSVPAFAEPTIGVYFDAEGVETHLQAEPGVLHQAYVLIKDADMLIGGAAFRLGITGEATVLPPVHPAGLLIGDLESGLEIGLYQAAPQFGSDPFAIAELSFFSPEPADLRWTVTNHPGYATPVVASSEGLQTAARGLTATTWIRWMPEIGVFFDEEATLTATLGLGLMEEPHLIETWLCVRTAEMLLGGAAFRLSADHAFVPVAQVPAEGIVLGDLDSGVEMGLYEPVPVFGQDVALLYRLTYLIINDCLVHDLEIQPHPDYSTVVIADHAGILLEAQGLHSRLEWFCCSNEPMAWGRVKALYR